MKKFFLLFVVLVAALLAVPGVIGFKAESEYNRLVEQFAQSGFSVVVNDYQRGWFGARVETEFQLDVPQASMELPAADDLRFTLSSELVHGPLMPSGGLGLAELNSRVLVDGEQIFPEDYPVVMRTLIGLDGGGVTTIDLPATVLEAKEGRPEIDFQGMTGEISFSAGMADASADIRLSGVDFSEGEIKKLRVKDVTMVSDSSSSTSGLMLGKGQFSVGEFTLSDFATDTAISLKQLSVKVKSDLKGEVVAGMAIYRLDSLSVNDELYGPAQLQISLDNLSADALFRMQQALEEIQGQQLNENQRGLAVMSVLMGNAPELLKNDPRLSIDNLSVKTPDGEIKAAFSLQSKGLEWKEISNAPVALSKLVASADLSMPEKYYLLLFQQQIKTQLMQQLQMQKNMGEEIEIPDEADLEVLSMSAATEQLERLLAQEILLRQDDGVIFMQAQLSDGLLSVNGKAIPLPVAQ
jgi:uncharacterized protein YdgA (DUF945 family)